MNIIYLETCKERNQHGWQSDMDHSCSRPPARWHGIQPHLLRERKSPDVPITRPNSPQIQHPGPASPSVITSGNTCVVRLRRLASWRPRCVISCRSFRLRPCRIWKVTCSLFAFLCMLGPFLVWEFSRRRLAPHTWQRNPLFVLLRNVLVEKAQEIR